jgi:predicted metalloprotease with PDZ domain
VRSALTLALLLLLTAAPALADVTQPEPLPQPPPIPTPQDVPFNGTVTIAVDATDLNRHIMKVHEVIPVQKAGDNILLYPEYLPGDHGPDGPLSALAGLIIKAGSQRLEWTRDPVQVFAFHVPVPAGVTSLDVTYQYLSPPDRAEGRVEMTPAIIDLEWNDVLLYPAGYFSRRIPYAASLTLPASWQFGTALETGTGAGNVVTFKPTTLNILMDSPVFAGRYFSRVDLDPGAPVPVHMDVVADRPEDLTISAADLAAHRALVQQAYKNFGSHHYDHYDFLFSLSDELSGVGLEHHRSSEDGVDRQYFTDPEKTVADRDLLPHEYTHSWNGKFRRPADLWSPDFDVLPERDSLLWVYEGQTEYWGQVLAARSGIMTPAQVRDQMALEAASMLHEVGRSWRDLEDTTNAPIINARRPLAWPNYSRTEDYYIEGLLVWLDADTLMRQKSGGKHSLSEFAKNFFGINNGSFVTVPYTFDDIVKAMNDVVPYDWASFLNDRLHTHGFATLLDGITRGGYKLVFTDKKSDFEKSIEGRRKGSDFTYSVGLTIGEGGKINAVSWGSPAFKANMAKGGKIIAINGVAYEDSTDLAEAIKLAQGNKTTPIEILVQDANHFRTLRIDYHDGLRYPHLERVPNTPDLLDAILTPM